MPGYSPFGALWRWGAMFAGFYVAVLLVYWRYLSLNPVYDDVAVLMYMHPVHNRQWWHAFRPVENGFIRPWYLLCMQFSWTQWGNNAFPLRLYAIGVHVAVASTAAVVFRQMVGASWRAAVALGLSVSLASAAFFVIFYYTSTCDSWMALGLLISVGCFYRCLKGGGWPWMVGLFAGLVVSLGGKETGVAVAGILILMAWNSRERTARAWWPAGAVALVCAVYAAGVVYLQKTNGLSYENQGYVAFSLLKMAERAFQYVGATLFPGSFVLKPFWRGAEDWRIVNWALVVGAAGALTGAIWVVLRRRADVLLRWAAVLYLGAVGTLLPTSVVMLEAGPHSPIGRYLYAALVLVLMSLGCMMVWLYRSERRVQWRVALGIWVIWLVFQPVITRKSPGTREYRRTAEEWGNLVAEVGRESAGWPPMQAVTVYTGEQHGSMVLSEPYGMAMFRVYYPTLLANYVSNRVAPETTMEYVFDGEQLRRLR